MLSAHGSVSLQLLIVPVWSDREIPNSNCVLTVELPPPGFAVTPVHAGFKQVSLRRTTLWLQAALKKKSLKNFNTVLLKTVRYIPKKRRLYVVESFLKNFYTVSIQIRRRAIISLSPSSFSPALKATGIVVEREPSLIPGYRPLETKNRHHDE